MDSSGGTSDNRLLAGADTRQFVLPFFRQALRSWPARLAATDAISGETGCTRPDMMMSWQLKVLRPLFLDSATWAMHLGILSNWT